MDRLIKLKLTAQIACLALFGLLLTRVLFSTVPQFNQLLRNANQVSVQGSQLLAYTQTQLLQPLTPHLLNTASNAESISAQIQPKAATISANLMEMSVRGRRIAIAEEETWNSPDKVRQRNEWMNGVSETLANVNRILPVVEGAARDTRLHLNASFQQINNQVLPQATQNLQQVGVMLTNLSALSQTLNEQSSLLLQEATEATQQLTSAGLVINATLNDPRTAQVLRDLSRISAHGVSASEQIALMTGYGAETAKQAPELARRFNEIVKGAQGWQKVFNLLRLVGTVLGFFL